MWGSTQDPYYLDGTPRVKRSVELLLTLSAGAVGAAGLHLV
jgi:hypothetical protein